MTRLKGIETVLTLVAFLATTLFGLKTLTRLKGIETNIIVNVLILFLYL